MKHALALLLLAGCSHTHVDVGAASAQGGVSAHIQGGRGLATLFGLSILAAGIVETERSRSIGGSSRDVPPMAEDRRVSEQDCSKPLDYSLGNIRCK